METTVSAAPATALLTLDHVGSGYGVTRDSPVTLDVEPGDRVLVVGPSGSGKTSLLYVMAQLSRPARGRVLLGAEEHAGPGAQARARARLVSFVEQDAALVPHWSVRLNIEAMCGPEGAARACALLKTWGVPHGSEQPRSLSGGERQRVAIAAAVSRRTTLIVADEPTSSLDATAKGHVVQALSDVPPDTAVVVASHDPVWSQWPNKVLDLEAAR